MTDRHLEGYVLNLRAGDLVEVRSEREILATLDDTGALDALPFMPEMLAYTGKRLRVYKRADKTCDTIVRPGGGRRMTNTVHLEGLRCDGQAHGGCQAACLLFWKEAWLKRVADTRVAPRPNEMPAQRSAAPLQAGRCDRARLVEATCADRADSTIEPRYRCQATELRRASSPLAWWDLRQYVRELRSRNARPVEMLTVFAFWVFRRILRIGGYRLLIGLYDSFQRRRGGTPYPFRDGTLDKTPRETLDLRAGELVQVKSHEEILKTINATNRNRGLSFDPEMVRFCGGVYRVRARVERLIDEGTGRMTNLSNDCIILDGVVCEARVSDKRLFCPRSIFPYWREIWLTRVRDASNAPGCAPSRGLESPAETARPISECR